MKNRLPGLVLAIALFVGPTAPLAAQDERIVSPDEVRRATWPPAFFLLRVDLDLGLLAVEAPPAGTCCGDRWGRTPVARVIVEAGNGTGVWALPVEVILGYQGRNPRLEVLGWSHAPGYGRNVPRTGARPETRSVD